MATGLFEKPFFRIAGDQGLLAEYGDGIDPEINRKVRAVAIAIDQERQPGIIEYIPTYRSLIILYDPSITDAQKLQAALLALEERLTVIEIPPGYH